MGLRGISDNAIILNGDQEVLLGTSKGTVAQVTSKNYQEFQFRLLCTPL